MEKLKEGFSVQLLLANLPARMKPPVHAVAVVKQNKVKLASISNCDSIPTALRRLRYPQNSTGSGLEVGGGAAGDYFYAIQEDSHHCLLPGVGGRRQEDDGYHYTKIGSLPTGSSTSRCP